jgi:hypothetical protein
LSRNRYREAGAWEARLYDDDTVIKWWIGTGSARDRDRDRNREGNGGHTAGDIALELLFGARSRGE